MENELIRIFDALTGFAWTTLPEGCVGLINKRWCEYTGLSIEEAKRQAWRSAVHPDDFPTLLQGWRTMVASGKPGELEVRMRHCDGDYRRLLFRMSPLMDPSGRVVKWRGINSDIEERRRAEGTARLGEPNLSVIIDSIPFPVAVTTPSGEVRDLNQPTLDYFGKSLDELKGLKVCNLTHPEDRPGILAAQSKARETGFAYSVQSRHRRYDGTYRWFNLAGMPVRDARGYIFCWLHLLIDIDDRTRRGDVPSTAERDLSSIINTIPALAWSARTDGSGEFFNQHYLDYVGLSAKQANEWGLTVALHPDDVHDLTAWWQLVMASQTPGETEARLRRFDGEYRWFLFRVNPLRNASGNIIKWYGISIDIDDRKRAEENLRLSEAFLAEGQRTSLTGSFSWSLDTDVIVFSEELYRIFEFEPGTAVTLERIADRIHPDDILLLSDKKADARSTGADHDYEIRLLMPGGAVKYVHVVSHSTRGRCGQREYIGALQDVTQRRVSEETLGALRSELARMAKVNSLGALTASIAHEVNQPLSGVITNASTCLRMLAADPPNVQGALETARRTIRDGHRASDVITRVRSLFSKKDSIAERVNLNEAAKEVIALTQSTLKNSRVMLRTEFSDDLPPVTGDRVQLQQVILNLLLNATEAVSGVDDRPRQVMIRTEEDGGDFVRLTVRDSGVGFRPEVANKMFETFFTTKSSGMGIGLSISQSIVERHHGRLQAATNEGPGATFWFSIPRACSNGAESNRAVATAMPHGIDATSTTGNP
ncbi:PAS domain-containing protein [Dyella halodurans]|uniref:histidine kinase n=1 Tax=Dyella halodurans TaxID=1920171 RepID=A0ABV9C208_9GAMM|nr:PAS domain-containing protein [Dyella halodurans]